MAVSRGCSGQPGLVLGGTVAGSSKMATMAFRPLCWSFGVHFVGRYRDSSYLQELRCPAEVSHLLCLTSTNAPSLVPLASLALVAGLPGPSWNPSARPSA